MQCPYCGHQESRVTDSRDVEEGVRRRRECLRCGLRFTTYERVQTTALLIVKRDGRREEFNREKLTRGIRLACAKRPVSHERIEGVVTDVEAELQRLSRAEIPSSLLGEIVMSRLKQLDRVAYIRFASVYRNFADIDSFEAEVKALKKDTTGQLPLLPLGEVAVSPRRRGRRPKAVGKQANGKAGA